MRKIIHLDMDAFYASAEQHRNPALRHKPLIVGGSPDGRGVVATCSYEARKYGIRSGMPSYKAKKLCPEAVFIPSDFSLYKEVSRKIHRIFRTYTDIIEPLALDEAYLDVSANKKQETSASRLARAVKKDILRETGLSASAGVSYNKFLAKIASAFKKPDGLTVIPPEEGEAFVADLPVTKFWGVGPVTARKLREHKIFTGADLKNYSPEALKFFFGKNALYYHEAARGQDDREVIPHSPRKSLGRELTFEKDLRDPEQIRTSLEEIGAEVLKHMENNHLKAKTLTLKVKYHDFRLTTRSYSSDFPLDHLPTLNRIVREVLLPKTECPRKAVRLLGLYFSRLETEEESRQQFLLGF